MKERDAFRLYETKLRIHARDKGRCQYPGCTAPGFNLAHRIAQTKINIKLYGKDVIHHDDNLVLVCSCQEHNDYFNIGNRPAEREALVQQIREKIKEKMTV